MYFFVETSFGEVFEVDALYYTSRANISSRNTWTNLDDYIDWANDKKNSERKEYSFSYKGIPIGKVTNIRQLWEEQ